MDADHFDRHRLGTLPFLSHLGLLVQRLLYRDLILDVLDRVDAQDVVLKIILDSTRFGKSQKEMIPAGFVPQAHVNRSTDVIADDDVQVRGVGEGAQEHSNIHLVAEHHIFNSNLRQRIRLC